jgi:hypothetical protein
MEEVEAKLTTSKAHMKVLEEFATASEKSSELFVEYITELKQSLEAVVQSTQALLETDAQMQDAFTNWEEFLDMSPERLQPLQTKEIGNSLGQTLNLETVPEPKNAYAKRHQPGAIYASGLNEWYVESGTTADSKGGSGYLVTRAYVPERLEFRWFCTCIAAKQSMYTEQPYCKHIYAVNEFIVGESTLFTWTRFPRVMDVAKFLVFYEKMYPMSAEDRAYIEDLKDMFPTLHVLTTGYSVITP